MKSIAKYNLFNFFTTFAKGLVEVFIPIILYNLGIDIKNILLFFMFSFALNMIFNYMVSKLGEMISYKWIAFISAFVFAGMYFYIQSYNNLLILAFLYAANTSFYYLAKHNFAASVVKQENIGKGVGSFLIVMIIAMIPSSYVGSLLLDYVSLKAAVIIVLVIYLLGVIPLFRIKYVNHQHKIMSTFKKIPAQNLWHFAFTQFKALFFVLFPLYIFINVNSKYSFIGILNIVIGIVSIIFIWFYSKKMDEKKKDYMLGASIFLSIILLVEINIKSSILLVIMSVLEAISTRLYEVSVTRDFYLLDDKVDKSCYFLISELLNNGVKLVVVFFVFIFNFNLYGILLQLILGIFISGFVKFKEPKTKVITS